MGKRNIAIVLLGAIGFVLVGIASPRAGAAIGGTTTGATVTGNGPAAKNTSTTIDMSYFTTCPYITQGLAKNAAWNGYNFVFAGQGVASGISSIPDSDFSISQYKPWVVNNNKTQNFVTAPVGPVVQRGLTNTDSGGADILINYTPRAMSNDPTSINFVQAYIQNLNGAGYTTGIIDNGTSATPFYNGSGVAGFGSGATGTRMKGTIPLTASPTAPAWMIDVPYTEAPDTSESVIFQAFISSQMKIGDTTYNVLYGGVQWGYSYNAVATPEPASFTLMGGLLGAALLRRRRAALMAA